MEHIKDLKDRVAFLEDENRRLRERDADSTSMLKVLTQKLPTPAVALDAELHLMYANTAFLDLLDWQARALVQNTPDVSTIALRDIVSEPVFNLVQGTHISGEDAIRAELHLHDGDFNISVYNVRRAEMSVVLVSSMNNPHVRTTEVVARLQQTIDRNMSMIQQIASLLGEEVSQNASELAAIIQTIQYPDKE